MVENTDIIQCVSTLDMLVRASELAAQGIKSEFISRYQIKIIQN